MQQPASTFRETVNGFGFRTRKVIRQLATKTNRLFKALLIGRDHSLAWALPQLLTRAGFQTDAIFSSPLMRRCKFLRYCNIVPSHLPLGPAITTQIEKNHYDWIIPTEDGVLIEILSSHLPLETKLKILPIQTEKNFSHLYSKIGLSKIFSAQGVLTPPFLIAQGVTEVLAAAEKIGYPVLVKRDCSGGGNGVFEIQNSSALYSLNAQILEESLLIQKVIKGVELDLSGIYFEGKLIHFNYAKVEKVCSKFGISSLRKYYSLSTVAKQIFQELAHIGRVLGIHGFTNIGCIESEGRRFYFETDIRPTAWVEFPRFLGEDPAIRIREWFLNKKTLIYPVRAAPNYPSHLLLPYFLRLKRSELLLNRHSVWKFIPRDDPELIFILLRRFLFSVGIKTRIIAIIKLLIPKKYHKTARAIKRVLRIFH